MTRSGPADDHSPLTVVVLDDDPDAVLLMQYALHAGGGIRVLPVDDPYDALRLLDSVECDVLVTDVELPELTGLELLDEVGRRHPGLPVVVVTAFARLDYAVAALRGQAAEFLTKPLDPGPFAQVVRHLGTTGRDRSRARRQLVLAVGAHPDDVEIGVGGLLSAHRDRGDRLAVLTLTHGDRGGPGADRGAESQAAAEMIGARLFLHDLDDTRLAVGDPTLGAIQRVIDEIQPDTVYTHSISDLHQDHRAVHQATMVASRAVPTVACYQSPSATVTFHPNRFAGIDGQLDAKIRLLHCFTSQVTSRDYLESDMIIATARYWARFGGGRHSEPLEVVHDRADLGEHDSGRVRPAALTEPALTDPELTEAKLTEAEASHAP